MKCAAWLIVIVYVNIASAGFEENLLETFQQAREDEIISKDCQGALLSYIGNLLSEDWAIKMFDATSKIPVGISKGNFGELGQFEQCLEAKSENGSIRPRYCMVTIPVIETQKSPIFNITDTSLYDRAFRIRQAGRILANGNDLETRASTKQSFGITWSICLPSQCSSQDITQMLKSLFNSITIDCQTNEDVHKPLTDRAVVTIALLAVIAFLLFASTTIDLYYTYVRKEGSPHILLITFSIYSNGKKLLLTTNNSDNLSCLNGIRLWSMMWVIIGHVYNGASFSPVFNFLDLSQWLNTKRSMTIVNGTLSVDTFFLMAGTLLAYGYIKSKQRGVKFNIFQFYIHRYLRLTPVLAATVLVTGTLLTYMGTGPKWVYMSEMESLCRKNWWSVLLYIQNYFNLDEICLAQTWYLSVDMQLYVLSPMLLIPLWWRPRIGELLTSASLIASIVVPFAVTYIYELPAFFMNPNLTNIQKTKDYNTYYYMKTHTRAAPWVLGVLLGYILAKIKFQDGFKYLKVNKVAALLLWPICLATCLTCIYGGYDLIISSTIDVWANSFYVSLVRPIWALSLSIMIFLCVNGYGGPVNWFLSLPIYQILNRFTYSIYLLHYPMLLIMAYSEKTGIYFSELQMAYKFWGILMFSFLTSIIWVLAFESPIVILEKFIFGGYKKGETQEDGKRNGVSA